MARLDIGEALGEGFRLVGRRPLDTLVWGLAYFIFGMLPAFAILWWAAGDVFELMRAGRSAADFTTPQAMAASLKLQVMQPLMLIGSLAGRTLVCCAVFRAVMTPEDRGFFHLRFSSRELWVALVMVVQVVCMWLLMVALFIPVILLWVPAIIAMSHQSVAGWEVPVGLLACVAAFAVFVWLLVRFSMALPMTFATGQFRLFESWAVTRGHAWGLVGLYVVTAIVVGCLVLVVEGLLFGIGVAVFLGGAFDLGAVRAMFEQPPQAIIATLGPYLVGGALVFSLLMGPLMALYLGPWARAYVQLEPRTAEVF